MAHLTNRRERFFVILLLGILTTISPFSIDMYLPAFHKMAADFGTTTARISLSLSSYFVGLAVGQVFYGPFLDRFGRKRPMYLGLSLYVAASVFCALASNAESLIVARFFQSLGGCVASVGSTAMVRDFFPPQEGARIFSRLMLILSISPLFAPTVGGWVVAVWGWQAVFWILGGIVGTILALVALFLPEGHKPDPTVSLRLSSILSVFAGMLRDRRFFPYALSGAFSFAGLFAYLAAAPSIFMGTYGLSENAFGLVFAFLSIGMVGGAQFNIFLMKRLTALQVFSLALAVQFAAAVIFLVGSTFHWYGLYAHISLFFVYISSIGLVYPNAAALSLAPFEKNSGSAAALLGTLQMGIGAAAAGAFGLLKLNASVGLTLLFVVCSSLANTIFRACVSRPMRSAEF